MSFGVGAAIFSVVSANQIVATVPLDATSGAITVTASSGTAVSSKQFAVAPRISFFMPVSAPAGTLVVINGDNFEGATAVRFNGTNALFAVTSSGQISATVPAGAKSGPITVTTPVGTATSSLSFTAIGDEPFISGFAPPNGKPGDTVILNGVNFTGATAVRFNGTNAPGFRVNSATQISVPVPASASTGPISVTTKAGTGQSADLFLVTTAPVIDFATPPVAAPNSSVTINGHNFTGVTAVRIAGKQATTFRANADTQIQVTVPTGATNGPITVTTPQGTGTSHFDFYAGPGPIIVDFDPVNGAPGSLVSIDGYFLTPFQSVKIAGVNAAATSTASTQIQATVPNNATNGPISVTTSSGTAVSVRSFYVRTGKPIILGFDPSSGVPGATVTIDGLDFTGTTSVKFNGVGAQADLVSDSQISALVPNGATTGPISISNPKGTTVSAGDFVVAPRLTSFSPATGVAGTAVTVRGTNFTHMIAVMFNGYPAAFTNKSANELVTTVPDAATPGSISVTTDAGIVASTNFFLVLPTIRSFTPLTGQAGTVVNISGTGFGNVQSVTFGGVAAEGQVISSTQIQVVVPSHAVSGPITVTTDTGTATSSVAFAVGAAADLGVTFTASTNTALQNQVVTYVATVGNLGPSTATGVVVTNAFPGAWFLSASVAPGTLQAGASGLRADVGSLTNGATAKLTVTLLMGAPGTFTNTVQVTGREQDLSPTNNNAVLVTSVLANTALLEVEEAAPGSVEISWPASAANFSLELRDAASPGAKWQAVTTPPVTVGNRKVVTVAVGSGTRLYRLTRP